MLGINILWNAGEFKKVVALCNRGPFGSASPRDLQADSFLWRADNFSS